MTVRELYEALEPFVQDCSVPSNADAQVFAECPETGHSWTIVAVTHVDGGLILSIGELSGPRID